MPPKAKNVADCEFWGCRIKWITRSDIVSVTTVKILSNTF